MTEYSDRVEFYLLVTHDDEMLPPCEYKFACRARQAKNIAYLRPCPCGKGAKFRLCCDQCKEMILLSQDAIECAGCDNVTQPARHAFRFFETLSGGTRR